MRNSNAEKLHSCLLFHNIPGVQQDLDSGICSVDTLQPSTGAAYCDYHSVTPYFSKMQLSPQGGG